MPNKFINSLALVFAILLFAQNPSFAHEYWIEPTNFRPMSGEEVLVDLRVGSNLKGQALSYIPQLTANFQIVDENGARKLEGRAGDRPALVFTPEKSGLNTITYQTTKSRVIFSDWQKFQTYLDLEGLVGIAERHRERGLPQSGFAESYSRFAKSLVLVGGELQGQDRATGMTIELVALTNPYSLQAGEELSIQLLYLGEPLTNNQISVFVQDREGSNDVEVSRIRTDENGQIKLQMQVAQIYLLNSIKMVEVEGQEEVVWESFWASLTFGGTQ